jgi:hypothetical protein
LQAPRYKKAVVSKADKLFDCLQGRFRQDKGRGSRSEANPSLSANKKNSLELAQMAVFFVLLASSAAGGEG